MSDRVGEPESVRGGSSSDIDLIEAARFQAQLRSGAADAGRSAAAQIPGYKVIREIHRGGQGVVYEASQEGTRRRVAIKVMREGPFAGARDRVRFEQEIQILAQLRHPSIVTVHESGSVGGCQFHVMDYIDGVPLDEHASAQCDDPRAVVRLFAEVAEAVNAAHLRGVIHRDLKPSNILVDTTGKPFILDFGLAKLTPVGGEQAEYPAGVTATGQFVGSLPWASPEQAEGLAQNVDVRTDVYSMGVMMYHALTGRFPYAVDGPIREVLDRIVAAEPVRPRALERQIGGEIETIVLKCLAKSRDRRYQTAGELARDCRALLEGRPIEARRDSTGYLVLKTLRRHWVQATMAATLLVLVVGFAATITLMYQRQNRALAAERAHSISIDAALERELERRAAMQAALDEAHDEIAELRAVLDR